MALVEAGRYLNSIEAGMARARLEAAGIMSVLFDQEMSWVAGSISIRLMVDDEDLDEARAILAD
jgi:hypothetical protein